MIKIIEIFYDHGYAKRVVYINSNLISEIWSERTEEGNDFTCIRMNNGFKFFCTNTVEELLEAVDRDKKDKKECLS